MYLYDASGSVIGMQYHAAGSASTAWDIYWFEKNLQGDIVAIYNASGTKLVSYIYDAWGNATVALVFEYDFETDKLEYEMFVISYDNEGYRIVHDVSDWNEDD